MADLLYYDESLPIIDVADNRPVTGRVVPVWARLFRRIVNSFNDLNAEVGALGIFRFALADQPTWTSVEAGRVAFETTHGHLVRWTGTVWEFAPGDVGNGFFRHYAVAPQEAGWALCDGSATTRLVVGAAALTTASFTTPNLTGSPHYLKPGSAYSGSPVAASGSTDNVADSGTAAASTDVGFITYQAGATIHDFALQNHDHDVTLVGHAHSVDAEPSHLNVLPYFRR